MKKIVVEVQRTTQIEVLIDENIVNKRTLDAIQYMYDEDLYDLSNIDTSISEEYLTREDVGYYNYARYAALQKLGRDFEFVNLERGHTNAKILSDNYTFEIDE